MALRKTYGKLLFDKKKNEWVITEAQPHICIKLKSIFPKIHKTDVVPFFFTNSAETATDLRWFMERYPFEISDADLKKIETGYQENLKYVADVEEILLPDYHPSPVLLKGIINSEARPYQIKANQLLMKVSSYLLGDDLGLGKTVSAILGFSNPGSLPALVVCQTHLVKHWVDQIAKFTYYSVHVIKTRKAYTLPHADIYIFAYSKLQGWIDFFGSGFFKYAVFDEMAELRHSGTNKWMAAVQICKSVTRSLGLSATPIYNYGNEIFIILNVLKPGCLGKYDDFIREWCTPIGNNKYKVNDGKALGTYLRDNYLFLRRNREEVGMEMPKVNTIIHEIEYDQTEVDKEHDLMLMLAMRVTTGSFTERGEAARELDMRLRRVTGIAKARYVAEFCKILLDNGEPVLLSGWHRDVYAIWAEALKEYNPVWYTGTESVKVKNESIASFVGGKTNLMIISNRSGLGIDGLQERCCNLVVGELDYSPQVHKQLGGRIDRPGQTKPVTFFYLVIDDGSDPPLLNVLGLKSSQAHSIVNPDLPMGEQYTDDSRIKMMAEAILKKKTQIQHEA